MPVPSVVGIWVAGTTPLCGGQSVLPVRLRRRQHGEPRQCRAAVLRDGNIIDPPDRRAAPAGVEHRVDLAVVTAEHRLDRAVAAVAHPAGQLAPFGLALDEDAIADALDDA